MGRLAGVIVVLAGLGLVPLRASGQRASPIEVSARIGWLLPDSIGEVIPENLLEGNLLARQGESTGWAGAAVQVPVHGPVLAFRLSLSQSAASRADGVWGEGLFDMGYPVQVESKVLMASLDLVAAVPVGLTLVEPYAFVGTGAKRTEISWWSEDPESELRGSYEDTAWALHLGVGLARRLGRVKLGVEVEDNLSWRDGSTDSRDRYERPSRHPFHDVGLIAHVGIGLF